MQKKASEVKEHGDEKGSASGSSRYTEEKGERGERGRKTKWRRASGTGSHHVRLYSATMEQAFRAISPSVTFSPSPWF